MLSIHVKVGIVVDVCNFSQMEAGCGDGRTRGPCGPVSFLYTTMNTRSCLKVEGEDGHFRLSSDFHTLAPGHPCSQTKAHTGAEEKRGEREGGRKREKG